jgi:tetratricopeptide (TPR) repeat protein
MRKAVLAFALTLLASAPAHADPSFWDKAREPEQYKAYQALAAVERMQSRAEEADFDFGLKRNFTRAALAMLELAGGGRLPDPRLKFLLAGLLLQGSIGREREARTLLEEALAVDPDSPVAVEGWFSLAIACSKLGDSQREYEAYTRALELTWDRDKRATIYMNRGESKMALSTRPGSPFTIGDALSDFRRALSYAEQPEAQALVLYDLGIALERSGDLPAALDAMSRARAIQLSPLHPSALDLPSVFFSPSYELYYYKALEAMSEARSASEVGEQIELWGRATAFWIRYLSEAEPDGHHWVPNARLHRASLEKKVREHKQQKPDVPAKARRLKP